MEESLPNNLREMANNLMELYDMAYDGIRRDVEYVILMNITDEDILAHVYDEIINVPTDKCYKLFVDLCDYVSMFNKELVSDYIEIYQDMYGDDEIEESKKI